MSGNPSGRPKILGEVRELARSHTEMAIHALVSIAGNRRAPPAARVSAASALLDRGYGRPEQAIAVAHLPAYAGDPFTVIDPLEASRTYQQIVAGTLLPEAVRFESDAPSRRAQALDGAHAVVDGEVAAPEASDRPINAREAPG